MLSPVSSVVQVPAFPFSEKQAQIQDGTINLDQNESHAPPSPLAIEAATQVMAEANRYPDPHWSDLKDVIADHHGLSGKQILIGAGSVELLGALIRCYAGPGCQVLSNQYGYAFFESSARLATADYIVARDDDYRISIDQLLDCVNAKTRIVCIANPGNPTGTYLTSEEILQLRGALRDDILLILDEAYCDYVDPPHKHNFNLVSLGNTVVLRTFSKAYGLAAMRIGWAYMPIEVASVVRKLLNPFNVSAPSLAAAKAAFIDQSYLACVRDETIRNRNRLSDVMRGLGLRYTASETNFILTEFPSKHAANQALNAFQRARINIRPMDAYRLENCLRISIGTSEQIDSVAEVLSSLKS